MPSHATPRHPGSARRDQLTAALLVAVTASAPLQAQLSARASATVSIRVAPSLAIRGVLPGAARLDASDRLTASSTIDVDTSLPYRVTVRLTPASAEAGARVFVRNASGAFEPLLPNASVTTAVSRVAGRRVHEVVCRVERANATLVDAGRCALVYELAAEYHDTLLRTSVVVRGALFGDERPGSNVMSIQSISHQSSVH